MNNQIKAGIVPALVPTHCTHVDDDGTECTRPCAPLKVIVCGSASLYCEQHQLAGD